MKVRARWLPVGCVVLVLGSCVSLEDTHIPRGGVLKDQRTVVLAFAGPGPVIAQEDSKAETAAKITPGLALIVQSAQDERDLAASKDLAQYLPPFEAAKLFYAELMRLLPQAGHPGRLMSSEEAEITTEQLMNFDKASDILDWRLRYFIQNPDHPVPRNYETLLPLNDALVFEVDMVYGVSQDDQQNSAPSLACAAKLFRVNGMHALWRHEAFIEDRAGARLFYDFKREPQDLIRKWTKLLPGLAQKVVDDYKKELQAASLYLPPKAPAGVSTSTAAPTGWYAAPELPGMTASTAVPQGLSVSTTTAR